MEHLISNLAGGIRRETLDGREYLVAPATLIVPGVLNGSNGPLLYELSDLRATADAWNGMPIIAPDHPRDKDGRQISGRNPKVLAQYGVGNVYNVEVNGKLVAETWFDIEKANKVDNRIIPDILSGKKLELSTGLHVDREITSGVTNDGRPYEAIARRHRPDHLALLLDTRGACSVNDGCGVNNEEAEKSKSLAVNIGSGCGIIVGQDSLQINAADLAGNGLSVDGQGRLEISVNTKEQKMANPKAKSVEFTDEERETVVNELITNCSCYEEGDRETLNAMDAAMLAKCKSMMEENEGYKKKLKEKKATENKVAKSEPVKEEPVVNTAATVTATKQHPTFNEMLERYPEMREAHDQMMKFIANRKQELIEQILVNRFNTFTADELKTYDLEDETINGRVIPGLQTIVNRLTDQEETQPVRTPSYIGAAVGNQAASYARKQNIPDPLGLPETQWQTIFNEHGKSLFKQPA